MCQWFAEGFTPSLHAVVARYLRDGKAQAMRQLLDETAQGSKGLQYRFLPFSFDTRPLSRLCDDDVTRTAAT